MNYSLIATYLQYLRKSHHYTQDELAKKLEITRQAVSKWETGVTIPESELKEILVQLDSKTLVTALMEASPAANRYLEKVFSEIDFEKIRNKIGRVRIEMVEQAQEEIVAMVNLWAAEGK